jgi:hypothetical protein
MFHHQSSSQNNLTLQVDEVLVAQVAKFQLIQVTVVHNTCAALHQV